MAGLESEIGSVYNIDVFWLLARKVVETGSNVSMDHDIVGSTQHQELGYEAI